MQASHKGGVTGISLQKFLKRFLWEFIRFLKKIYKYPGVPSKISSKLSAGIQQVCLWDFIFYFFCFRNHSRYCFRGFVHEYLQKKKLREILPEISQQVSTGLIPSMPPVFFFRKQFHWKFLQDTSIIFLRNFSRDN